MSPVLKGRRSFWIGFLRDDRELDLPRIRVEGEVTISVHKATFEIFEEVNLILPEPADSWCFWTGEEGEEWLLKDGFGLVEAGSTFSLSPQKWTKLAPWA